MTGVGVSEKVLKEIRHISHNLDISKNIEAYDKNLQLFCGKSRLPLSFFIGERSIGGLGENAEKVDLLKFLRKINKLFTKFEPFIRSVLSEQFGFVQSEELVLRQPETMDSVNGTDENEEEKEEEEETEEVEEENGQETEETD